MDVDFFPRVCFCGFVPYFSVWFFLLFRFSINYESFCDASVVVVVVVVFIIVWCLTTFF